MATQKIKFTEAEKKLINKTYEKIKRLPNDQLYEQEYREEYTRPRRFREEFISMPDDKINHCRTQGGTMSGCCATKLKDSEKHKSQKACHFYQKASFHERCTFETFGEYCWCPEAQVAAKKG